MANTPNRTGGRGGLIALCVGLGLLLGAGAVTPVALNYRTNMQKAEAEAKAAAQRADQARADATALEQQKAEMRENLGEAQKTISTLQTDLTDRSGALDALQKIDDVRANEVETLKADVRTKSAEVADLSERLVMAQSEVEKSTKQSDGLTTVVNGLRGEVSRMTETIDVQGTEIKRLVEVVNKTETEKQVAIQQAQAAETHAQAVEVEIMTMAPVRIEERHSTLRKRKIAEKAGVPFGPIFDGVGDLFQGAGEGLMGKKGPVILVAVYRDGREETLTSEDVNRWRGRGVSVVRLASGT